jgi:hypothetical protein
MREVLQTKFADAGAGLTPEGQWRSPLKRAEELISGIGPTG